MKKCPFCAEEILDEAIKCKHCGASLKTQNKTVLIIGSGIVVIGLVIIFLLPHFLKGKPNSLEKQANSANTSDAQKPSDVQQLGKASGHIYVTLGSGESQIVRGAEVFLIQKNEIFLKGLLQLEKVKLQIATDAEKIFKEMNAIRNSDRGIGYKNDDMRKKIEELAIVRHDAMEFIEKNEEFLKGLSKEKAKATYEGEYTFQNIPVGEYFVFSKYQTNFNNGYWIVPVSIEQNQAVTADLDNQNMEDAKRILRLERMEQERDMAFELLQAESIFGESELSIAKRKLEILKIWENPPVSKKSYQYPSILPNPDKEKNETAIPASQQKLQSPISNQVLEVEKIKECYAQLKQHDEILTEKSFTPEWNQEGEELKKKLTDLGFYNLSEEEQRKIVG